jgi:hypothetical protein
MLEKNDRWGDPELDKAVAENDAIFAELDGLKGLVEKGQMTIEQAQVRFMELLERHRLVGERLLVVARAWSAMPGNAGVTSATGSQDGNVGFWPELLQKSVEANRQACFRCIDANRDEADS